MSINAYDRGDTTRISGAFVNASGAATDPTTVTLRVRNPSGTATTPTPVKDSTGNYHYDLALDASGLWTYRWEGTGAVATAEEGELFVRTTAF